MLKRLGLITYHFYGNKLIVFYLDLTGFNKNTYDQCKFTLDRVSIF